MSSNHLTPKVAHGSNHLVTQTHYVCILWEQLLIILQLANIGLDFSQKKNLSALVDYTLLNHEDIFFMIVGDSIVIRILDMILLAILSSFWRLIQMLLLLQSILFWLL